MLSRILVLPERETWAVAGPNLVVSLVIAEVFYKFHSFVLEAVAMLVTWWLLTSFTRLVLSSRKDTG